MATEAIGLCGSSALMYLLFFFGPAMFIFGFLSATSYCAYKEKQRNELRYRGK